MSSIEQNLTSNRPPAMPKAYDVNVNDEIDDINKTLPNNEPKSREVSPKLVVGGKKYGRRSRPQSATAFESSESDSEEDYDFAKTPNAQHRHRLKAAQKVIIFFVFWFKIKLCATMNGSFIKD